MRNVASVIAGLILLVGISGCSTTQSVVVRAEQLDQAAFLAVDSFLEFEKENRTLLWMMNPEIKHAADDLRVHFPPAHAALKNATRAYKHNRTEENLANLATATAVIETLRRDAMEWHAKTTIE